MPDSTATPTEIRFFPEVNLATQFQRGKFATMEPDLELEIPEGLIHRPLTPILLPELHKENTGYRSRSTTPVVTKIRLYGRLGRKFGRVHHLAVETPAEAMHALDTLFPGFRKEIRAMSPKYEFQVKIGERYSDDKGMYLKHSGREISITPILEGRASGKGVGETILGAVLVIVGIVVAVLASWTGVGLVIGGDLIGLGVGLIIGGIAALIAGTPTTPPKEAASYNFGGSVNVVEQGVPAALAYGKVYCGSVVGSSSILARDVTIGSDKTPGPNAKDADFNIGGNFTEELGDGTSISVTGDGPTGDGGGVTVGTGTGQGGSGGGGGGGGGGGSGDPIEIAYYPERTEKMRREAMGAGGGSSSGSSAKEDPDSLESREYAQILDIIGEGPILGLVNAQQSIFLNDTPIQNPDGTFNFQDYTINFFSGTQDQSYIPNFDTQEATANVGYALKQAFPYVSTIENPNLNAIRINVTAAKMEEQNTSNGDISGSSVSLTIELATAASGGQFVQVIADTIKGKCESAYTRSYLVDVPDSAQPGPYTIRVTRLTKDSTKSTIVNDLVIESVTQIIYVKLKHPNTVKCGLQFDAEQFPDIPTRTYYVYGLMISVPTNYDPMTKAYAVNGAGTSNGEWDGTFKTAWTCNPAWVLWDILTQSRYGLGQFIQPAQMDKWAFYAAAQYCDELVPNGLGGQESRYEFHAYIAGREEALKVVSDIAGIMRAAAAFIGGVVVPVMDRYVDPSEYLMPFGPANVINANGADFSFSNSSHNARHNVALVQWNDPSDMGRPKTEYVENAADIAANGIRELNVSPIGCYSQGQAHRSGLWALLTEASRTEVVSFSTGFESAGMLPGDVLPISATFRAGRNVTGRIAASSTVSITMDREVTLTEGNAYTMMWTAVDGSFQQTTVANPPGTYTTLNFAQDVGHEPSIDTTWILSSTDLVPELYRILTITRQNNQTAGITAVAYNPSLYDAVEDGFTLESYPISVLPSATTCEPPSNFVIVERAVVEGTGVTRVLQASWEASPDPYLRDYQLKWRINGGNWKKEPNTDVPLLDVPITTTGSYDFMLTAFNSLGAPSLPLLATYVVDDSNPLPLFQVTGLELFGNANGDQFGGRDIDLTWQINSPSTAANDFGSERYGSGTGDVDPSFKNFTLNFYRLSDQALVYSTVTTDTQFVFTYELNCQCIAHGEKKAAGPYRSLRIDVLGNDVYGDTTLPAEIVASNPEPDQIDASTIIVNNYFNGVTFLIPDIVDLDFAGVVIYGSENLEDLTGNGKASFVPDSSFIVYNASSTTAFVLQSVGTTFHYRFGAYDAFNPNQFILSDPISVKNNFLDTGDLAQDIRDLLGIIPITAAGLATEITNRVDGDSALYAQFQLVYAIAENNAAAIETIQTAFASFNLAYANFTQEIQVQVAQNTAAITDEATARANADTSLATQISTVKASVDGISASISVDESAIATINGKIQGTYTIAVDVNGYVSGIQLTDNGSISKIVFKVNKFKIVSPATANEPPITPFVIRNDRLIVGCDIQSADYAPGQAGWLISQSGYSEFNNQASKATTQAVTLTPPTGLTSRDSLNSTSVVNPTVGTDMASANPGYGISIRYTKNGDSALNGGTVVAPGTQIGPFTEEQTGGNLTVRAVCLYTDSLGNVNASLGMSPEVIVTYIWSVDAYGNPDDGG